MNEALVIYFILKLPVLFHIGGILLLLGTVGCVVWPMVSDPHPNMFKKFMSTCISFSIVGIFFLIVFPTERQANIMALSYAGFEGIEAVKEMTADSEVAKNSIEAYNTMLKQYIDEHSTGESNE